MTLFEDHKDWAFVKEVSEILIKNGFKAYLAGGCVRDALLGRDPNDFDVATDAIPEQVEDLFDNVILVGKSFGVIKVVGPEKQIIDVATFRTDASYTDGRRPDKIEFSTPEEDASRRDFTINSMFYDMASNKILDFYSGQEDIKHKLIETVGKPMDRMHEDYLRALRAVRFSAQLDFDIEKETFSALKAMKHNISKVSSERISDEFRKILKADNIVRGLNLLESLSYFAEFLPCIQGLSLYEGKLLISKSRVEKRPDHILFLLIWPSLIAGDVSLQELLVQLKKLKYSNDSLMWFKDHYTAVLSSESDSFQSFLLFDKCDFNFLNSIGFTSLHWSEFLKVQKQGRLPVPLVTGQDLLGMGIKNGPMMGHLLTKTHKKQVLEGISSKPALLSWLKSQEQ